MISVESVCNLLYLEVCVLRMQSTAAWPEWTIKLSLIQPGQNIGDCTSQMAKCERETCGYTNVILCESSDGES